MLFFFSFLFCFGGGWKALDFCCSQCVPQHVPNSSSLYPISFFLSSTLVMKETPSAQFYLFIYLIFQFCNVFTLAIIHKGDLAVFGYRPAMQVTIYESPFKILATCLNIV